MVVLQNYWSPPRAQRTVEQDMPYPLVCFTRGRWDGYLNFEHDTMMGPGSAYGEVGQQPLPLPLPCCCLANDPSDRPEHAWLHALDEASSPHCRCVCSYPVSVHRQVSTDQIACRVDRLFSALWIEPRCKTTWRNQRDGM